MRTFYASISKCHHVSGNLANNYQPNDAIRERKGVERVQGRRREGGSSSLEHDS